MPQRFCLACDLDDEAGAIAAYEDWHRVGRTPPAVIASIRDAGITNMEIFRVGARLVMIVDADDGFSFERKAESDASNPAVLDWEARMLAFQRPLPQTQGDAKWLVLDRIFRLTDHLADASAQVDQEIR